MPAIATHSGILSQNKTYTLLLGSWGIFLLKYNNPPRRIKAKDLSPT